MKYFYSLLVIVHFSIGIGSAQSFHNLGSGFTNGVYSLYYDNDDSILYAGGIYWSSGNGDAIYKIAQWDGLQWDTLKSGVNDGGYVRSIQKYDGKIFVGGTFNQIGGIVSKGLATWDGTDWNYFGDYSKNGSGFVLDLYIYGNELYIGGGFNNINGIPAYGLARYDGTNIYTYPSLGPWFTAITSIAFYNGELYVGGNFDPGGGMNDIAKFNGSNWVSVGGGFSGGATIVDDMIVFNGELYISGHFLTAYGDPGNLIVKWNGSSWSSLGSGLVGGNCFDLHIFNNELYVGGSIIEAGGIPVTQMAKWNGSAWSSIGASIDAAIVCFESANDNLYMGGGFITIDGDTMNRIARYDLETGFTEISDSSNFELFPNSADDFVTIKVEGTKSKKFDLEIIDITGKRLFSSNIVFTNGEFNLNIEFLNSGLYLIRVFDDYGTNLNSKLMIAR